MSRVASNWSAAGRGASSPSVFRRLAAVLRPNPGWLCVASALGLSMLGVTAIDLSAPGMASRHIVFLCLGVLVAVLVAGPRPDFYRRSALPLAVLVLAMLVLLLVPFVPEAIVRPRNGARRWISLFVTDLQPSELAKIVFMLVLAASLRFRRTHRSFRGLLPTLLIALVPMGLILMEPDLGTALLFLPTLMAMLIAAGARYVDLFKIMLVGLVLASAMLPMLRPHQRARIMALVAQVQGDARYENDIGYQGARSMTLIGAGGMEGHETDHASMLLRYNHLPERHNDMIFTVICARWGVWGAIATWGAYLTLLLGGLWVAVRSTDPFGRLVAVGISTMVMAQMLINSGMCLGLFPITGMTLPFVSYGGSSLVVNWIMIGLLLCIARSPQRTVWREPFQFSSAER
ncbi:MAG TPA: hypothetical protein DEO57_00010 [Phycisphaerales bacterium]|nr:hypothetical protein [Phycisphaerales bacterium]